MAKFPTPDQVRQVAADKLAAKIATALEHAQLRVEVDPNERWVLDLVLQDLERENWHGEIEPNPASLSFVGEPGVLLVLSEKRK